MAGPPISTATRTTRRGDSTGSTSATCRSTPKYRWRHTGAGVTAYVIDSGIRFSHVEFEGRAISGPDFVDDDADSSDCNGHGTHVAGTVGGKTYGVAKAVTLVGIRVLSCAGTGTVSDVLAAFDWVLANAEGRSVINLSLQTGDDPCRRRCDRGCVRSRASWSPRQPTHAGEDACALGPGREPTALTVAASTMADARGELLQLRPVRGSLRPRREHRVGRNRVGHRHRDVSAAPR